MEFMASLPWQLVMLLGIVVGFVLGIVSGLYIRSSVDK